MEVMFTIGCTDIIFETYSHEKDSVRNRMTTSGLK